MKEQLTKGLVSLCHLLGAWIRGSASTLLSETKTVYNVRLQIEAEPMQRGQVRCLFSRYNNTEQVSVK